MIKIFFVGDFKSNTGPGIANKSIKNGLNDENATYSVCNNKISRFVELFFKMLRSDGTCFCGYSKINFIGIKFAKILNKKTFYLMHGYATYEYKMNNSSINKLAEINKSEKYIFENVDKVFCVSKKFMQFMKEHEPKFAEKFDYNFNGIDFLKIETIVNAYSVKVKANQVVSIGGGMKQKNNLAICKAIDKINREKKLELKFVVIGLPYTDKEEICEFKFVKYYEKLTHEDVLKVLKESYLYVQNSSFETFGLAIIEALLCDCNLLVSNKVGAVDVIDTLEKKDLIFNNNNIEELAEKIICLLAEGNMKKLKNGINKNKISQDFSGKKLWNKISKQISN